MNKNACPLCRRSMRCWAIDARHAPTPEVSYVCVRAAIAFRDECLHTTQDFVQRYNELTAQLVAQMRIKNTVLTPTELYEASTPLRAEIEKIKNLNGGLAPKLPLILESGTWQNRRAA